MSQCYVQMCVLAIVVMSREASPVYTHLCQAAPLLWVMEKQTQRYSYKMPSSSTSVPCGLVVQRDPQVITAIHMEGILVPHPSSLFLSEEKKF